MRIDLRSGDYQALRGNFFYGVARRRSLKPKEFLAEGLRLDRRDFVKASKLALGATLLPLQPSAGPLNRSISILGNVAAPEAIRFEL